MVTIVNAIHANANDSENRLDVMFTLERASTLLNFQFICAQGITVITGPSGSGKTSLLDCIAGLLAPTNGHIQLGEQVFFDSSKKINLPPQGRQIGYVLQRPSLFPHMTVRQNIAYAIKGNKHAEASQIVSALSEEFNVTALLDRRPDQISGGQAQRIALVRAIAATPRLFIFDEPLSNLDEQSRFDMIKAVKKVRAVTGKSILYVTHSASEADELADQRITCKDNLFRLACS